MGYWGTTIDLTPHLELFLQRIGAVVVLMPRFDVEVEL